MIKLNVLILSIKLLFIVNGQNEDDFSYKENCNFIKRSIIYHNKLRYFHSISPLQLNANLHQLAKLVLDSLSNFETIMNIEEILFHNGEYSEGGVGLNLLFMRNCTHYACCGDAEQAINVFYDEIQDYTFDKHESIQKTKSTDNFIQVIWKDSKYLGVGRSINKKLNICYILYLYYPAARYVDLNEKMSNVQKPIKRFLKFRVNPPKTL